MLAEPMHCVFVKQPPWPDDEQQRDEPAEYDHPIAADEADRLQHTDIQNNADQRPECGAQTADQAVGKTVHAQHDVEDFRLDLGIHVRIERPADAGNGGRHDNRQHLVGIAVHALGLR